LKKDPTPALPASGTEQDDLTPALSYEERGLDANDLTPALS